jgi:predicted permease
VSSLIWLERLWQDVRYGCRALAATPTFTIVAVLSLAIGIGANCAIFSFADALLLRPLPVPRPGDVYTVGSMSSVEAFGASSLRTSYRDYVDIRDRSTSFEGLGAFDYVTSGFAVDASRSPKLKMGMVLSGNLMSVMGIAPVIGRGFRAEEDQVPGRDAVVVLGHKLWEDELGSDPGVLGRRIRLNGHDFTVIGVAPGEFTGLDQYVRADFFAPVMMSPWLISNPKQATLEARDARNLTLKGRLRPGVTQGAAQAELTTIGADLERAYPDTNKNRRMAIRTELQARMASDPPDAQLAAMLATLALAVLFVACANVAGLLTSRAPARAREMALRLAIGAGRGQLVRQLITESLLLALAGGVAGLGVGYAGMRLFRQIEVPTDLPIVLAFRMDQRALVVSLIVSVASAILFGLVPAIQATRTDLTSVMKAGDSVAPGRRRRWGRPLLVGGQVAVSVVLLVIAMFMYRAFRAELAKGPGYRTDHLLMMTFDPTLVRYSEAQTAQFFEQVAERARTVPGVKSVAMATSAPMNNDVDAATMAPEGYQFPVGKDSATILCADIDEHYFPALALTLVDGRNFRSDDGPDAPRVAIVNQQFAQHYWPGQQPVGKRLRLLTGDKPWVQVVGLAKTSKYLFIAEPPTEFVYFAYRQRKPRQIIMLAESNGDAAALAAPLREVVRGLDPNLPIYNVRTMEALYRMRAISVINVLITTVGGLGVMGLALAIVGLYALIAYAVSRRTREIGIRMAIGADRVAVLRMVLRQGLLLSVVGLVVGLVGSVGAGILLRAAFAETNNQRDPAAILMVIPVVLAVTFVATYLPARRASRVDPVQALRYE